MKSFSVCKNRKKSKAFKEKVQPTTAAPQNQKPKFMNQKSLAQNINHIKIIWR